MAGRRKRQEDHVTLPFDVSKGMWTGGDRGLTPRGYVSKARNMTAEPLRWDQRPQFTYDNLTNVRGLAVWSDTTNRVQRLVAFDDQASTYKAYVKGTSGESWGADISSADAANARLLDATNYRGALIAAAADVSSTGQNTPLRVVYYDGTSFTDDPDLPFAGGVYSVTTFKERVIYGGVRLKGANLLNGILGELDAYGDDLSAGGYGWYEFSSAEDVRITSGSTFRYRVTPNADSFVFGDTIVGNASSTAYGNSGDQLVQWRCDLLSGAETTDVSLTLAILYSRARVNSTAYAQGNVVVGWNGTTAGMRYRCLVAGTSTNPAPVGSTTIGSTFTDGGVTWVCEGLEVAVAETITLPSLASSTDWTTTYLTYLVPSGSACNLKLRIIFGTEKDLGTAGSAGGAGTFSRVPIDVSYRDGLTAADPRKANHGQQFQTRAAEFLYPFFQNETITEVVIDQSDYVYWSEPGQPLRVLAPNFYRLNDGYGPITASRVVGGQLCVFKRSEVAPFGATDDPDIPILPIGESRVGFGCLNPKSIDVFEDYGYFVGEDEVYRWKPDMPTPEPLCGDAMREEIMARNTTTTTTGNGVAFTNQPANDGVEIGSDNAADTTQTATVIGTTTGTDTVVVESIALTGTTFVSTVKTDWGVILAVKLSASCAGTVTFREASGNATITTVTTGNTSKGVETVATAQQLSYNGYLKFVASGSTTKQIGVKGTNPAGTAIYDSQALTGTTSVWGNSLFYSVTEIYTGDLESNRTVTETAYSWCEDQPGPANRALLSIDRATRKVYVYTQNGRIYVYAIDRKAWSVMDAAGGTGVTPYGYPVCDMIFNPNTRNMYFAFTGAPAGTAGLARLDAKQTPAADSFSSSGTSTVTAELWPRPLELFGPRMDMTVEVARIHHRVTAAQSGQTTTFGVSTDQGQTFSATNQVTLDPISTGEYRPMEVALFQTGGTLQMRVVHSGDGGAANFNVSQFELDVQSHAQEYNRGNPVAGSASL